MEIIKKHWVVAGGSFVFFLLAGLLWSEQVQAPVPTTPLETSTTTPVTATPAGSETKPAQTTATPKPFPINAADTISSWNFKGIYAGNEVLTKQATADITLLTGLLGSGKYDDYDLYDGIANDYTMLGDGTLAYQNFTRAIAIHPTKGLAFANLANLMDKLGAYDTAADAFTKVVSVEPRSLDYHLARLTYLTRQFAADNARITAAFTDASKQFGDTAPVLTIEAQWLTGEKRYADAIKAWEVVKALSIGQDTSTVDAAIAQLKAKQ